LEGCGKSQGREIVERGGREKRQAAGEILSKVQSGRALKEREDRTARKSGRLRWRNLKGQGGKGSRDTCLSRNREQGEQWGWLLEKVVVREKEEKVKKRKGEGKSATREQNLKKRYPPKGKITQETL